MAWIYLFAAGFFEIGWPVGFKVAQNPDTRIVGIIIAGLCVACSGFLLFLAQKSIPMVGIIIAGLCVACSGFLLFLAQKSIPMGTAYAVWTAIGVVGTFLVGIIFYNDPASFINYCAIMLIVTGVILLKLAS